MHAQALLAAGFRIALFAAGASLAAYIPYKYATQLHAIEGLYAFVFPWSALLALAAMALALKPDAACSCPSAVRAGSGVLAASWIVTGLLCVPSLAASIAQVPAAGLFAAFHMVVQHLFLSASVLAFALAPRALARALAIRSAAPYAPGSLPAR